MHVYMCVYVCVCSLVFLFNGILIFMGYLIPKVTLLKNTSGTIFVVLF